jgi:hypothetical protein
MATQVGFGSRIKDSFSSAKLQLVSLEKQMEGRVQSFERQAKDVPAQLRGAFETVLGRIRQALSIVTRDELALLAGRVEELTAKVDALLRVVPATVSGVAPLAIPARAESAPVVEMVAETEEAVVEAAPVEAAAPEAAPAKKPAKKQPQKNNRK